MLQTSNCSHEEQASMNQQATLETADASGGLLTRLLFPQHRRASPLFFQRERGAATSHLPLKRLYKTMTGSKGRLDLHQRGWIVFCQHREGLSRAGSREPIVILTNHTDKQPVSWQREDASHVSAETMDFLSEGEIDGFWYRFTGFRFLCFT